MSDPDDRHEHEVGDRVVGVTGEILQVDGDWHIEDHDNDDGPVILHNKCGVYLCDLNRQYPLCRGCGATIPPSMISGFTMLNWNKSNDDEYFVQPGAEVLDFVYNGHLHMELRKLAEFPNLDEATVAEAMEKLTKEKP